MTFVNDQMLWVCAFLVPSTLVFLIWSAKKKEKMARLFIRQRLFTSLSVGISPLRQKMRMVFALAGVTGFLIALARPQWGFTEEEIKQRGIDILLAIDTSKSMLANDILPNRLERSKLAAFDLMNSSNGDRLGLIAFSGTAFLQCPLTFDTEIFRQTVDSLDVGIIPQGGTSLKACIEAALEAYESNDGNHFKILVVFTDGEDHEEGALEAADKAASAGLRIYTVGVGTPAGEILRMRNADGNESFVKDAEGNVVKSRLNESLLVELASITQGAYVNLADHLAMERLYEQSIAPLPKSEFSTMMTRTYFERFQWPLGFAILFVVMEMLVPDPRPMQSHPKMKKLSKRPALSLLTLAFLLWAHLPVLEAGAGRAKRLFDSGDYVESLREYEKLLEKQPSDPKVLYNAGTSAYFSGDLEKAGRYLSQVVISPDIDLQQQAYYNLGHVQFERGRQTEDLNQKIKEWTEAVKLFEGANKLNPDDQDAGFNRDAIQKLLEQIQPPPQDNPSDSNQEKEEKEEDPKNEPSKSEGRDDPPQENDQDQNQQQEPQQQQEQEPQTQSGDQGDDKEQQDSAGDRDPSQVDEENQPQTDSQQDPSDDHQSGSPESEPTDEDSEPNPQPPPESRQMSQMTREEALKLLESLKDKERALLFQPPKRSGTRTFKDW